MQGRRSAGSNLALRYEAVMGALEPLHGLPVSAVAFAAMRLITARRLPRMPMLVPRLGPSGRNALSSSKARGANLI